MGIGNDSNGGPDNARRAGGILAGIAAKRNIVATILQDCPEPSKNLTPFLEGVILGGYRFDRFKSRKSDSPDKQKIKKLSLYLSDEFKTYKKAVERSVNFPECPRKIRVGANSPSL